ncbi:hypothetical protein [Butyrivibrio sp. MC2021]|uniref:hypothetical protein n=1 Tax=Butyrivibrio sp. MC2021 TaxID=1408306 RepID=UPI00047CC527|nr:hypothetical protein [Butyrivibrio sp. MC2021]
MEVLQISISGIISGFLLGLLIGCALAAACYTEKFLGIIFKPVELVLGKFPEITLILPVLFHDNPEIIFYVCTIATAGFFYGKIYKALAGTDDKLLEMAHIFRMPTDRKIQYIFLPQILGELKVSALIGIVRCFVIGIAAGVICNILS